MTIQRVTPSELELLLRVHNLAFHIQKTVELTGLTLIQLKQAVRDAQELSSALNELERRKVGCDAPKVGE